MGTGHWNSQAAGVIANKLSWNGTLAKGRPAETFVSELLDSGESLCQSVGLQVSIDLSVGGRGCGVRQPPCDRNWHMYTGSK